MQTYEEMLKNGKVSKVSLELLEPSPYNSFKTDDYTDLKGSILSCGLITPLTVVGPSDEGKYQIISGGRRYLAISEINRENPGSFDTIPVYIIGDIHMDALKQKLLIESSNIETRDYDDADINDHRLNIVGILKEMEDSGEAEFDDIREELGKYIKVSRRYSNAYLKIYENGTKELQDAARGKDKNLNGSLKTNKAAVLAGKEKSEQKRILGKIEETSTKENIPANKAFDKVMQDEKKKKKQPKPDYGMTSAERRTVDADFVSPASEEDEENYGGYNNSFESEKASDSIPTQSSAAPLSDDIFGGDDDDEENDDDNFEATCAWIQDAMHKCKKNVPLNEREEKVLALCREWISLVDGTN